MEYNAATHSLQCPKCQQGMVEDRHEDITIDRCTHCGGLWFDDDEAHQLKNLVGSEALDSGDPHVGWTFDSNEDIDCPRCGKQMHKSSDPKQKHIWYEVCDDHGMFLDAGEFTDFKNETALDWFRGLIKGDRKTVAP